MREIRLLVSHAFESEFADVICAVDVADYNLRGSRAFESVGLSVVATNEGRLAKLEKSFDLMLAHHAWKKELA